MKDRLLNLGY